MPRVVPSTLEPSAISVVRTSMSLLPFPLLSLSLSLLPLSSPLLSFSPLLSSLSLLHPSLFVNFLFSSFFLKYSYQQGELCVSCGTNGPPMAYIVISIFSAREELSRDEGGEEEERKRGRGREEEEERKRERERRGEARGGIEEIH